MPIYTLTLQSRREIARQVIELKFNKPEGLSFIPGQYAGFTLINPSETDANGITRRFSILSSPFDNYIAIATRLQNSAYKRVLNSLIVGNEIKFAGPTGNFTLHEDPAIPAIFIAGGIGITPFHSMLKNAIQRQSEQQITLFYGNQTRADACYLEEIKRMQNNNPHFNFIPTFATPDEEWKGETGFITQTMLKKYITDLQIPIYYICGSPAMVTALQETLMEMNIAAEKIKVEDFPGY